MYSSRNLVSCGDSAPPSTRLNAKRARLIARRPRYLSASATASFTSRRVARASASMATTASTVGRRQARSSAVRVGVVTTTPRTICTSSGSYPSDQMSTFSGGRRFTCRSCAFASSSTHFAPWTAAAERPATTPLRPVHSHAATARDSAVLRTPFFSYTSGWTALYRVRRTCRDNRPSASASLPMNGSAMGRVCRCPPTDAECAYRVGCRPEPNPHRTFGVIEGLVARGGRSSSSPGTAGTPRCRTGARRRCS